MRQKLSGRLLKKSPKRLRRSAGELRYRIRNNIKFPQLGVAVSHHDHGGGGRDVERN